MSEEENMTDIPEEQNISDLPAYLIFALEWVGYEDPTGEMVNTLRIEPFRKRWGGLDLATFAQVLKEGQGEERLLAIFAIGYEDSLWARSLLLPLLESVHPLERWASALCLGRLKDERAFPALEHMLTEFLSKVQYDPKGYIELSYEEWRAMAFRILGEWEDPKLAPMLGEGMRAIWRQERHPEEPLSKDVRQMMRQQWKYCQKEAAYALGRLGAFEMMKKLDIPEPRLSLLMIYGVLGFLHVRTYYPDIYTNFSGGWNDPVLKKQVAAVLQQRFGCSEEEQKRCIALYDEDLELFWASPEDGEYDVLED